MTQHNHAILCQQNGKFTTQGKLLAPLLVEIYLLLDSFAEPPYAPQVNDYILFLEETPEILTYILDKHPLLKSIPVMYDLDFAHTQPLFTIIIGAQASIDTNTLSIHIEE